jgi:hypothetical protein
MAVSPHPSVRPTPPTKPPATSTTSGTKGKIEHGSGQAGIHYGFNHELHVTPGHGGERNHDFTSSEGHAKHAGHKASGKDMEGSHSGKVHRPGDEKHNDEPG